MADTCYNNRKVKTKMKKLSNKETHKILGLLSEHPDLVLNIEQKLSESSFEFQEGPGAIFDKEYFAEFFRSKLQAVLSENREKIKTRFTGSTLSEQEIFTVFGESGSFGISILIEEMLEKMER